MTQYEHNTSAAVVHLAEQVWADAQNRFEYILDVLRKLEPSVYAQAGGNNDGSVLFDYMKNYIIDAEAQHIMSSEDDNPVRALAAAHSATILWCAVAITKLVRAPRTSQDDPLAQLENDWRQEK